MSTTTLSAAFQDLTPDGAGGLYFMHAGAFAHSNGTAAGTRVIVPKPVSGSGQLAIGSILGRSGSTLFLTGGDGAPGTGIVVSDGTAAGTRVLRGAESGLPVSLSRYSPWSLSTTRAVLGNHLYFVGQTAQHGYELWRTDGSEAGTEFVKDIVIGPRASHPYELTVYDGMLYFSAEDQNAQRTLWRSDGSTDGTSVVVSSVGAPVKPSDLSVVDGALYFAASDRGGQYWLSIVAQRCNEHANVAGYSAGAGQ